MNAFATPATVGRKLYPASFFSILFSILLAIPHAKWNFLFAKFPPTQVSGSADTSADLYYIRPHAGPITVYM